MLREINNRRGIDSGAVSLDEARFPMVRYFLRSLTRGKPSNIPARRMTDDLIRSSTLRDALEQKISFYGA